MYNTAVIVDGVKYPCSEIQKPSPVVTPEGLVMPPGRIFIFPGWVNVKQGSKIVSGNTFVISAPVVEVKNRNGLIFEKKAYCSD